MNWKKSLYNQKYSHIYVEEGISGHERTGEILKKFPEAKVIVIKHYKDLFNRKHQNFTAQHESQALILASLTENFIYKGAPVCQSFDNENFYYTSNVMNCLYDCEYCYLKGMYQSGNMVIFVNIEDTFKKVEELLKNEDIYLCISYDTDLLAIENVTGFIKAWADFTEEHKNLKIEIRTKSARTDIYDEIRPCDRVIWAYTISPEYVADHFEHGAGNTDARLEAAAYGMKKGFRVRLCFDPMIYCRNFKKEYGDMLSRVSEAIDLTKITDASIGSFRISQDYMKKMRKAMPGSETVQFPFNNVEGVYQYPEGLRREMEDFLYAGLSQYMPAERIYLWKE